MATIAELKQKAVKLAATETEDSITPHDVFDLQRDTLAAIEDVESKIEGQGKTVVDTTLKILKVTEGKETYYCDVKKLEAPDAPAITTGGIFPLVKDGTKVVTITNNQGGTCYYTADGTPPTTKSSSFTSATKTITLTVDTTVQSKATTVKALVVKNGLTGNVASATYTLKRKVSAPSITAGSDAYASSRSITISSDTTGASIQYSIDGTTPSTSYSSAFSISSSKTVKAKATLTGWEDSDEASTSITVGRLKMYYKAVSTPPKAVSTITGFTALKANTFPQEITFSESGALKGCFCYDKDLGDLTKIVEVASGYNVITGWAKTIVDNYNVYTANGAADFKDVKIKFDK